MSAGVTLSPLRWWDLPAVLRLEADLFPQDAWSAGMFWSELADRALRRYVVARKDGQVVGYAGLSVAGGEAEVRTIAVARSHWSHGVGALLLADALAEAERRGAARMFLEVRVDNERARRLYERFGFVGIGVRRGYYQPANVDALVMAADLPAPNPATGPHASPREASHG